MGKVLEKIVADRLMYVLEKKGLLNDNQAGFRRGRCTTDQVLKLVQQANDQFHAEVSKNSSRTIAAFFDYEKAYDKVPRKMMTEMMLELEFKIAFKALRRKVQWLHGVKLSSLRQI